MKFSYNWIREISGVNESPEKMAELLTMHSFQVDSVDAMEGDTVLNIDILPNRTHDCLSHAGVAKEVAMLVGVSLKKDPYESDATPKESATRADSLLAVEIEDAEAAPRYSARVMDNIKVGPSPEWMTSRLEACGLRSINNIVDTTNYVMLEMGQPLHAFDAKKLQSKDEAKKRIIVRKAKEKEGFTTIDGKQMELDSSMLIIADEAHPIALAGIKGGSDSAIDNETSTIIIESANFDSVGLSRTSRKIGLATDASIRFAAGLDPNLTIAALNRAAALIEEMAGGEALKGVIDVYPKPWAQTPIVLDVSYVNRLLGVDVPNEKITSILESVGCEIKEKVKMKNEKGGEILVTAPTVRVDLATSEDLIEEVGRIIGYENIPPAMPVSTIVPASPTEEIVFADRLRDALAAAGMTETYNYSLIPDPGVPDTLTLENPMSDRRNYLRPSLLPGLIKNAGDNMRFFGDVRMFEVGRIFSNAKGIDERLSVGGVLARKSGKSDELFYELKGILNSVLERLRAGEAWFDDYKATPEPATIPGIWDESRTAEIKLDNKEIGFLGVIQHTEKFAAVAFELDVGALLNIARSEQEFTPIPKYPSVTRDISMLVSPDVRISQVENAIENAAADYIQDVDLFDIFEPDSGQKGLAFHIIYQADDHTLTDSEVNSEHAKIEKILREKLDAEVR